MTEKHSGSKLLVLKFTIAQGPKSGHSTYHGMKLVQMKS